MKGITKLVKVALWLGTLRSEMAASLFPQKGKTTKNSIL